MPSDAQGRLYYRSLTLTNVRSFKGKQTLDLTTEAGGPAPWTLLLGDNGVGKTTVLECLARMRPDWTEGADKHAELAEPSLTGVDNETLRGLARIGEDEVFLEAEFAVHPGLNRTEAPTGAFTLSAKLSLENGDLQSVEAPPVVVARDLEPLIIAYGAARHARRGAIETSSFELDPVRSLFDADVELIDARKILQDLDHAASRRHAKAKVLLSEIKDALTRILPDIKKPSDIHVYPPPMPGMRNAKFGVQVATPYGEVPLEGLSLGYQTMAAWTVDLAWRLYNHYPSARKPLEQPAIVLIDEVDLHLHPKWQRGLREHISNIFPSTQFIVTGHSPILAQTFLDMNIAVIHEINGCAVINSDARIVKTWRIDELVHSMLFDRTPVYAPEIQQELERRSTLLAKSRLTVEEKSELGELNSLRMSLDPALSDADKEALDVIRRAADLVTSLKP